MLAKHFANAREGGTGRLGLLDRDLVSMAHTIRT